MYSILHQYLLKRVCLLNPFRRMKSVLVIAEHNNEVLTPITQSAITAAKQIGGDLTILIAGTKCDGATKCVSAIKGLKKIIVAEDTAFNGFPAENLTSLILDAQKQFGFTHIMAGATVFGKAILPRVAAKLNVPAITEVIDFKTSDTFVRPIYAGNAFMTLKVKAPVKVITIRKTDFTPCILEDDKILQSILALVTKKLNLNKILLCKDDRCRMEEYLRMKRAIETLSEWQIQKGKKITVQQSMQGKHNLGFTTLINQKLYKPKLSDANIIICGGKGMKSANNFKMLNELAENLNGVVGASKAAVEEGFASSDIQIGHNANTVAPNLYIAVGVSGKAQHIAEMKNSKTIVAININPRAQIFKIANYGLVADLFKVIPELNAKLK